VHGTVPETTLFSRVKKVVSISFTVLKNPSIHHLQDL